MYRNSVIVYCDVHQIKIIVNCDMIKAENAKTSRKLQYFDDFIQNFKNKNHFVQVI